MCGLQTFYFIVESGFTTYTYTEENKAKDRHLKLTLNKRKVLAKIRLPGHRQYKVNVNPKRYCVCVLFTIYLV